GRWVAGHPGAHRRQRHRQLSATAHPTHGPRSSRLGRPAPVLVVTGLVVAAVFAAPLGYLVAEVVRDLGASIDALRDGEVAGPLGRTLVLAVSVTLSATVAGT